MYVPWALRIWGHTLTLSSFVLQKHAARGNTLGGTADAFARTNNAECLARWKTFNWKLPGSAVCLQKSWREAYLESSASITAAKVCIQSSSSLFEICKMLTGISNLLIDNGIQMDKVCLHPLSACSCLTSITFTNDAPSFGAPRLDLLLLPSELRELGIQGFEIEMNCFKYIKCNQVTSLRYMPATSPEPAFLEFLRCLPDLQVCLQICAADADTTFCVDARH